MKENSLFFIGLNLDNKMYEPLSKEREAQLFELYNETKDQEIRNEIITRNTRLVASIVTRHFSNVLVSDYHFTADQLFQIGIIGLIQAIDKYDPTRGTFSNVATLYIKKAIYNEIYDNTSIVSGGFHTIRAYNRIMNGRKQGLDDEEIRNRLNVNQRQFKRIEKNGSELVNDTYLDKGLKNKEETRVTSSLRDHILRCNENNEDFDRIVYENGLKELFERILDDDRLFKKDKPTSMRTRDSIKLYFMEGKTYDQISKIYGVSRQCIQQAMVKKLQRIKKLYKEELEKYLGGY